MKLSEAKIEQIKEVLIEAQEKIEKHLNIDSLYDVENVEQDPLFNAFHEIESGLYDIIKELKAKHIA